jgi:hypothetical protein
LGTNEAISIPTNLVESLIHFGDPTLARNGRAMAKPRSSKGFLVNIFGIAGRETSRPEGVDDDGRSTTWRKLAERLVHR